MAGLISGCRAGGERGHRDGPGSVVDVRSARARVAVPVVLPPDASKLAADNRAFAADLHGVLRAQSGNLVYSPASVSMALAMLFGGARGNTANQMAQALHFTLPSQRLHAGFAALALALARPSADPAAFRLTVANAVWGQRGYPFLPAYLDLLAESYGAGIHTVDFQLPEQARSGINRWIADNTGKEDQRPHSAWRHRIRVPDWC